jgi:hypothetical protein
MKTNNLFQKNKEEQKQPFNSDWKSGNQSINAEKQDCLVGQSREEGECEQGGRKPGLQVAEVRSTPRQARQAYQSTCTVLCKFTVIRTITKTAESSLHNG